MGYPFPQEDDYTGQILGFGGMGQSVAPPGAGAFGPGYPPAPPGSFEGPSVPTQEEAASQAAAKARGGQGLIMAPAVLKKAAQDSQATNQAAIERALGGSLSYSTTSPANTGGIRGAVGRLWGIQRETEAAEKSTIQDLQPAYDAQRKATERVIALEGEAASTKQRRLEAENQVATVADQELQKLTAAGQAQVNESMGAYKAAQVEASKMADIDPERLFRDSEGGISFGKKLWAALAMGLGAFGSATTGAPNYAMQLVNQAVDRDIEAQKMAYAKARDKASFAREAWGMAREIFSDEYRQNVAARALRLEQARRITEAELAKTENPLVQAKGQELLAQMDAQKVQMESALHQRTLELARGTVVNAMHGEIAAAQLERQKEALTASKNQRALEVQRALSAFPGAKVKDPLRYIPEKDDMKAAQKVVQTSNRMDATLTKLIQHVKDTGTGKILPDPVGKTLAGNFTFLMRQLVGTGAAMTPQEFSQMGVPEDPTGFISWGNLEKLQTIQQNLKDWINGDLDPLGYELAAEGAASRGRKVR